MITNDNIWMVIAGLAPLFASVTWMFLLLLGLRDSKTKAERAIKMSFLLYQIVFIVGYSLLTLSIFRPYICGYFASLVMAAFMFTPVLFYRLVWLFTDGGRYEPFPYVKHLSLAIILTLIFSGWFLFIPASVQSDMIAGREIGPDYGLHYLIFRCRPFVQLLFISAYVFLLLRRLIKYNRSINPADNMVMHPSRHILYTLGVSFLVPVVSALLLFTPQQKLFSSPLPIILVMFFVVLHSLVGYRIICSGFKVPKLPPIDKTCTSAYEIPIVIPKKTIRHIAERVKNAEGKVVTVPLTRRRFEEYMKEHKPYLDPDLKITNLIEPLKANRTVISKFVNQTYGVNFNRYINHLRINELERLKKLSANKDTDVIQLLSKAGFSSMRNYTRAIVAEQDTQTSKNR